MVVAPNVSFAAATQKNWSISPVGVVTSLDTFDVGNYAALFMAVDNSGTVPGSLCTTGGSSNSSGFDIRNYIGANVKTAGGIGSTNCATPGSYFLVIADGNTIAPLFYYKMYWNGSTVTAQNPTSNEATFDFSKTQYIEIKQPTYSTTTPTNSVYTEIDFKNPHFGDSGVHMDIGFRNAVTDVLEATTTLYIGTSTIDGTYTNTFSLSDGSKKVRAAIFDNNDNIIGSISEVFFNVKSNSYFAATGLISPYVQGADLSQVNCTLYDVGCQFQKAMSFLFRPKPSTLSNWGSLWQTVRNKPPFGYVTVTITALSALSGTSTSAFSMPAVPFMTPLFTPLRDSLGVILWALYAIGFYLYRLKTIDV